MAGNVDRVNRAALWVMLMLSIVSSWYPFALDLPRRVVNSAAQRPDGAWELDGDSRLMSPAPAAATALFSGQQFSTTVVALPAVPNQVGPARLVSIGRSPYDPGLMIGIDHNDVVLYLRCGGAASDVEAVWRTPLEGGQRVAVNLWIDRSDDETVVSMQVNDQQRVRLDNRCPAGTSPGLPESTAPWALGNVYSGHRPFVGRVVKLEMAQSGRSIDLLRAVPWQAPSAFWVLPERLYQPSSGISNELLAALWHFASFALLGYCLAGVGHRFGTTQLLAAIVVFAAILNGGKVLIAERHPAAIDLALNVAGAVIFLYMRRRFTDTDGFMSRQTEPGCSAPH